MIRIPSPLTRAPAVDPDHAGGPSTAAGAVIYGGGCPIRRYRRVPTSSRRRSERAPAGDRTWPCGERRAAEALVAGVCTVPAARRAARCSGLSRPGRGVVQRPTVANVAGGSITTRSQTGHGPHAPRRSAPHPRAGRPAGSSGDPEGKVVARHRSPKGRRAHLGPPLTAAWAAAGVGGAHRSIPVQQLTSSTPARLVATVVAGGALAATAQHALSQTLPVVADGAALRGAVEELVGGVAPRRRVSCARRPDAPAAAAFTPVVAESVADLPADLPVADAASLVKAADLQRAAAEAEAAAAAARAAEEARAAEAARAAEEVKAAEAARAAVASRGRRCPAGHRTRDVRVRRSLRPGAPGHRHRRAHRHPDPRRRSPAP